MSISTKFGAGFKDIVDKAGQQIRVRYFNETIGSVWDDDVTLVVSGNDWMSGVIFPVNTAKGSSDSLLLEQGKIIDSDKKVFINGSIVLTGSDLQCKVQIGSPTGENYEVIADGGIAWTYSSDAIYKKAFLRRITTGSFIGE